MPARSAWRDAAALSSFNINFNAAFLPGGQTKGEAPRLCSLYAAGNFVAAWADTQYFQIGESKYGKPILDRLFHWQSNLEDAASAR